MCVLYRPTHIAPILTQLYFKTIKRYVCPISFSVLLCLKYFKVVQGHVAPSAAPDARSNITLIIGLILTLLPYKPW